MLTLLAIMVPFLLLALFIGVTEAQSGYMGDSSMVPGILIAMVIIVLVIALIMGNITIRF